MSHPALDAPILFWPNALPMRLVANQETLDRMAKKAEKLGGVVEAVYDARGSFQRFVIRGAVVR